MGGLGRRWLKQAAEPLPRVDLAVAPDTTGRWRITNPAQRGPRLAAGQTSVDTGTTIPV
jgi:hypothetical protein